MTRPDKRAARFGDRYTPPADLRKLGKNLLDALPAIKRMTEAFRRYADAVVADAVVADDVVQARLYTSYPLTGGPIWTTRYGRSTATWSSAAVTATAWRTDDPDILGRIDDTLLTYDSQRSTGEDWPFSGSF